MEMLAGAGAVVLSAMLGGMATVYGIWEVTEKKEKFYRVWSCTCLYPCQLAWLLMMAGTWYLAAAAGQGIHNGIPEGGYLAASRLTALLLTYILLTVVDIKQRIVPDRILVCYFLGQLLMGAATIAPAVLLSGMVKGLILGLILLGASWLSRGRLGMGDAKLLTVTAMTAGWIYSLQLLIYGMGLAFLYGIWLLLFRHRSAKTEFPFVPFLTAGMIVQISVLLI